MSVRPLLVSTVLCVLFNVSPLFAADQPPQVLLTPPTGQEGAPMVEVPTGSFPMGVPHGDRDGGRDEYPRHDVFVDTFFIDKFEVTNGRYLEYPHYGNAGNRTVANWYLTLLAAAGAPRARFGVADPSMDPKDQIGPLAELLS